MEICGGPVLIWQMYFPASDSFMSLMDKMYVKITILHPVNKTELTCSGKINDYELN